MQVPKTTISVLAFVCGVWVATDGAQAQPGTVLSHQKISDTQGDFGGMLDDTDLFGSSVSPLGDLDGDGTTDLAVGAAKDDDGGLDRGAVWVLFLNEDGTVKGHQKISDTQGGFGGALDNNDVFGISVSALGDLDGDGVIDLAVGARDDDGGSDRGAVWILFLNDAGSVKGHQKISDTQGGFGGALDDNDVFGIAVSALGDLDGDGVADLAVGAWGDDDGGFDHGAVWILFLNSDGTVKSEQKISDTQGGFDGGLNNSDWFGSSIASLSDLDGDGVDDIAVGARLDDDGGSNRGAVWVLLLNTDGTVKSHQKISDNHGDFGGALDNHNQFGRSLASLGNSDGDGVTDLAVGAHGDDDGGTNYGAVWLLFLHTDGTVKSHQKISDTEGGFDGMLDDTDLFGSSVASLVDLDGDGTRDLAVGAGFDDDGGTNRGAVWVLFLDGAPLVLDLDIKPGSCPNPFNRHGNGVLPVALVGTGAFDPTQVDLSTLQLSRADGIGGSTGPNEGPPGPHSVFEDLASPFDGEGCECHDLGSDGIDDLSMKFKTQEVVDALHLHDLLGGQFVALVVTGNLIDGQPFMAEDCIWLVPPDNVLPANAMIESEEIDAFVEVTPVDLNFDSDGFTNLARTYVPGTMVTLTAEPVSPSGRTFLRWLINGASQPIGESTISVTITDDLILDPVYGVCQTDLTSDGSVNAADLALLLGSWGPCADCADCLADLNGDCIVSAADLALLLGSWGVCG